MNAVLQRVEEGLAELRAVDLTALSPGELRSLAVGLQRLADRARTLQARVLHAADEAEAHAGTGASNVAGWLAEATQSSYGDAARQCELGGALAAAPWLAEAVDDGTVSLATAAVLSPLVEDPTVGDPAGLLDQLAGAGPSEARRIAGRWAAEQRSATDDDARRAAAHHHRSLRFGPDAAGMVTLAGQLPTVEARAVRAALAYLAGPPVEGDGRSGDQRLADALVELCDAYSKGQVGGGRERPTLLVTVPYATVFEDGVEPAVTSFDEVVPGADLQRMLCDCRLHRVIVDPASVPLDLGRRARTASTHQYHALVVRDRRCRWPGCERPPGWCDAHHIQPWTSHHGATDLDQLVLLCRHHHTTTHLPGWTMTGNAHRLQITTPDGDTLHSTLDHTTHDTDESGRLQQLFPAAGD